MSGVELLACPKCGSRSVAGVCYGLPPMPSRDSSSFWAAVRDKRIVLGGCCITGADPRWHCNQCGHRWGKIDAADRNPDAATGS